jgi:hypothetical protein
VILVDTSAWVELLRDTGHPAHVTLTRHLEDRRSIAIAEPIIMELLAGTRSRREHDRMRSRLLGFPLLRLHGLPDFERAAEIYRICRAKGGTVRKLIDCLIAVLAIRERATLLHNDRDFDTIARYTALRLEPPLSA